jgi:6-phosphogluconolactonase/glucosamine-6-phosphate isomerase/deaminase
MEKVILLCTLKTPAAKKSSKNAVFFRENPNLPSKRLTLGVKM